MAARAIADRLAGVCTVAVADGRAKAFLKVDRTNRVEPAALLGEQDYAQRVEKDGNLIDAIAKGLLRRDLYELRAA